ncbi:MAG: rRNA pseudouridine synthase [Candidatus Aminicenantes bacterium]|nr:rRNA pseudouridine synthase [Candidatus Aminicenantes bacterium]
MSDIRLNKYLSQAGVASRREADRMIERGEIKVNGRVIRELGCRIDPSRDKIVFQGREVACKKKNVYIMVNKPRGYIVTTKDPQNRPQVLNLLPSFERRIYPVGRLDADSEGLLLLTDDGELAYRLTHPRFQISKIYLVKVKGHPGREKISLLEKGIFIDGKKTSPASLEPIAEKGKRSLFQMTIREGRKREIRRMFASVGHEVIELKRVQVGSLKLGDLKKGHWRFLRPNEVHRLKKQVSIKA